MDSLYYIFIYPLELMMEWVLINAFAVTNHYGAALFLLSICVNVALLPLYHVAESWQGAERRIQKRMSQKLKEFKQVFSGEERFMMIKTLYRQHRYHPICAMRGSLGFAIQVPFFIAAYHLLSHFQPFEGVSIFFFKDLTKPDALLWGMNCMPFLMSGVNLLSAFVYTQNLSQNDKTQLWVISILFLVLLYPAPVALVLYWTFNNIFSLVKNIAYARFTSTQTTEHTKEQSDVLTLRRPLTVLAQPLAMFFQKINTPAWVKVPLFVFFLERMYHYQQFDPSTLDASLAMKEGVGILIYLTLTSLYGFMHSFRHTLQHYVQVVLLAILGMAVTTVAIDWMFGFHALLDPSHIKEALAVAMLWTLLISIFQLKTILKPVHHVVLLISSVAMASVFFFFNPLYVYTSSPEHIGYLTLSDIYTFSFRTLIVAFALYSLAFVLCGYVRKSLSTLFMTGPVWLALMAFIYGYLVPVNFGVFRGTKFSDEILLFTWAQNAAIPEFLILALAFFVLYKTLQLKPVVAPIFFCIIIFFLSRDLVVLSYDQNAFPIYTSTSLASFAPIGSASGKSRTHNTPQLNSNSNLSELGEFRFSKTRDNIVLLIPDAGAGYVFSNLFKNNPSLAKDLDGFTFYPNAVSAGAFTLPSTAALIGGPKYTPFNVNQNPNATIENNIIKAYQWLESQLHAKGYESTFVNPAYVGCTPFSSRPRVYCLDVKGRKDKRPLYELYGLQGDLSLKERLLHVFSLFKSLPISLKSLLYQSQYWDDAFSDHGESDEGRATKRRTNEAYLYHLHFKSMPQLSKVEKDGASQFIHLWTSDLIFPFTLNDSCHLADSRTFNPDGDTERGFATFCHLQSFIQWLNWMKKEGVYDNTKIIVVSDHGASSFGSTWYEGAVNPIFMVKDFGKRGDFNKSERLLYNADTSALICSAIGGCQDIGPDPTQHILANRTLRFSVTSHGNIEYARNSNSFQITRNYEFTEKHIRNPNWRELVH